MLRVITTVILACAPSVAWAVECRSVGGHVEGRQVQAVRQATLNGKSLTLTGVVGGQKAARQKLSCTALTKGVICEATVGRAAVVVMTNGNRMTETVRDMADGHEAAGIAYVCDGPIRF